MLISERRNLILELLQDKKTITSTEIMNKLFVSEATVRRDLTDLEKKGLIVRTRGGAVIVENQATEISIVTREQRLIHEKRKIANSCLAYIKEGNSYFIDSSTTVAQLIPLLHSFQNITVITNGINNALLAAAMGRFNVYLIGGLVYQRTNSALGSHTIDSIDLYNCNTFIFSCTGISLKSGITEASFEQALAKKKMLKNSACHILLVDHTKFDQINIAKSCEFSDIDVVITDRDPSDDYKRVFKNNNIELIVA